MRTGIGSHQSAEAKTIEWLTPPEIIEALGPFDLDPCSPMRRPWPTATTHYSLPAQNGLALPWFGRVWLNPPYGRLTGRWLGKMANHNRGIALIFARTETQMFSSSFGAQRAQSCLSKAALTFIYLMDQGLLETAADRSAWSDTEKKRSRA